MIKLNDRAHIIKDAQPAPFMGDPSVGREKTIAYRILRAHDVSGIRGSMSIRFDKLISHDITYVGIIQTARASGMDRFPMPYALTNCHNSLCAIGGTINEDDHVFGLSAAKKYGGIYVPANTAVIHQYAREAMAVSGGMILGSDSHTRYGALGTMGVGEGGGELVKQLMNNTWDLPDPEVVLVYMTGRPAPGVGPHDVALAICEKVYANGFVKNRVLEFAGPAIKELSMDFRIGLDVMTTETACLSSIWETDEKVREYYAAHSRETDHRELSIMEGACYDRLIEIDLSGIKSMIALPFHPSNAMPIRTLISDARDILADVDKKIFEQTGKRSRLADKALANGIRVDQGEIAGCSGGMFENVYSAAAILKSFGGIKDAFPISVYPPSLPEYRRLLNSQTIDSLTASGVLIKSCFCGPCFGAGDVPANGQLSVRHTTRNFPFREGAKPSEGQFASVALMDARSIAATAANGGYLMPADELDIDIGPMPSPAVDMSVYDKLVYNGSGAPIADHELRFGPNITDWPSFEPLDEDLCLTVASVLRDKVTTTDELIPSGETSSYRSNPVRLSEFTLSRRDPGYVKRSKASVRPSEGNMGFGSLIFANMPGDGSAREQAASCQRVVGGRANIALNYATKRYRSNLINWGIIPFTVAEDPLLETGDTVIIEGIRKSIETGAKSVRAMVRGTSGEREIMLLLGEMSESERRILLNGCLINDYAEARRRV